MEQPNFKEDDLVFFIGDGSGKALCQIKGEKRYNSGLTNYFVKLICKRHLSGKWLFNKKLASYNKETGVFVCNPDFLRKLGSK